MWLSSLWMMGSMSIIIGPMSARQSRASHRQMSSGTQVVRLIGYRKARSSREHSFGQSSNHWTSLPVTQSADQLISQSEHRSMGLICWMVDWLSGWRTSVWLVDWLADCLANKLMCGLAAMSGWQVLCLADRLDDWLFARTGVTRCCLADWLIIQLVNDSLSDWSRHHVFVKLNDWLIGRWLTI